MKELTTAEAATALRLKERTIRHYVHVKRLHPSRAVGVAFMFDPAEIARFAAIPRKPGPKRKPTV